MSLGISYAGYRSGFPMPVRRRTTEDYGSGTDYPMGFTILQFAEFFWRARDLNISFDVSAVVDNDGENTINATSDYLTLSDFPKRFLKSALPNRDANIGDWQTVANESQLITGFTDAATTATGKYGSCLFIDEWFFEDFGDVVVGSWTEGGSSGDVWFAELQYTVDFWDVLSVVTGGVELFYPRMYFYLIVATDIVPVPVAAVFMSRADAGASSATVPLSICGATTELLVYRGAPTPSGPAVSASGSITIAPVSYWGYGGKWDTTTGARL
jgi:hypothetical protein